MKLLNEVSALNGLLYEVKKKLCSSIFWEVVHDRTKKRTTRAYVWLTPEDT
jgi:hypothetical protein